MIRAQYHFRPSKNGYMAWDVRRLVILSAALEGQQIPLEHISEIDEAYWFEYPPSQATGRSLVEHMQLVHAADLSYPILLDADGRLMDGMHRVCKAHLEQRTLILAKQFFSTPEPDYVDCQPGDLPYD